MPGANDRSMNLRLPEVLLRRLDRYRAGIEGVPTRPEALRRLMDRELPKDTTATAPAMRKTRRTAA